MRLYSILREKGNNILSIRPERSVKDAIEMLVDHNIGALLVVADSAPVGIITERDVLRLVARNAQSLDTIPVSDVMTRDLIVGNPDDEVEVVMRVLTEARIRHLPVLDGEAIAGMISIGDLVKSQMHEGEVTIHHLREYITGTR